jgi:rod shape-determining protein MreC
VIGVRDTRRTRVVLVVLLAAALCLVALDYADGSSPLMRGIRHVAGGAFGGVERLASDVGGGVSRVFDGSSASSGSQVTALQRQVVRLRAELSAAQLTKSDYHQLQRLLSLAGQGSYRVVAANVIAFGQGFQQTVTLDAGSRDGVRPSETVLNGDGLVGEVTSVTASTCTVQLITDGAATVGIELAPSGQVGWVTGEGKTRSGGNLLKLQVLNPRAVLTPGEQLVTSASVKDRPYVPGVPVGVIDKVLNRAGALVGTALVRPYADFSALGIVGIVISPPRHDPRFSVLPPRPRPSPTPGLTSPATASTPPRHGHHGSPSPTPSRSP